MRERLEHLAVGAPRRTIAAARAAALLSLALCAGGCASNSGAENAPAADATTAEPARDNSRLAPIAGFWAPLTAPTWVHVDREASFVLVEAESDLLVVRTDKRALSAGDPSDPDRPGAPISRITWMLSIPADAAEGDRFAFIGAAEGGPPQGWALESGNEAPRKFEVSGFVTILSRDTERMLVDLKVFPLDDDEVPDLLVQVECEMVGRPGAVAVAPLDTRSGVAHAPIPPKLPPRRGVDAVWPWGEIFGDYPPPKYATK